MSHDSFQNEQREQRPAPGSSSSLPLLILGIVLCLIAGMSIFLLRSVNSTPRTAAPKSYSQNTLKQFGLAFHNYHDVHNTFPPGATVDTQKVAHHSWMTQILPFLDLKRLYDSINMEIPWDDPENNVPFSRQLGGYQNPAIAELMSLDGYPASHYSGNENVFFDNSRVRIRDMTDGTSNVILSGEINAEFPTWGDPSNRRDPSLGININPDGFGSPFTGGASFLLGDGSVKFISETVDPAILEALSLPDDGEVPTSKF